MQKASQTKTARGRGSLRPSRQDLRIIPNIQINNLDKPIPISFPASQFENFECSFNDTIPGNAPLLNDCVTKDSIASLTEIQRKHVVARVRFHPPVLVNTNVQELCEPMEIDLDSDNAKRKRAMPVSSSTESQGGKGFLFY